MNRYITHIEHGGTEQNHPDTIVVHSMAEYIKDGGTPVYAVKFLEDYGLSAHALVAPGGTIYRLREDSEQAWHARGFNKNTLGIEFLVPGDHDYASFLEAIKHPYVSSDQYRAGLEQIREWIDLYRIKRMVRHSDISPGRKVDPGAGFPFELLLADSGITSAG